MKSLLDLTLATADLPAKRLCKIKQLPSITSLQASQLLIPFQDLGIRLGDFVEFLDYLLDFFTRNGIHNDTLTLGVLLKLWTLQGFEKCLTQDLDSIRRHAWGNCVSPEQGPCFDHEVSKLPVGSAQLQILQGRNPF